MSKVLNKYFVVNFPHALLLGVLDSNRQFDLGNVFIDLTQRLLMIPIISFFIFKERTLEGQGNNSKHALEWLIYCFQHSFYHFVEGVRSFFGGDKTVFH